MSLVEQPIPLQRRLTAELRSMTPAQRSAYARQCILDMAAAEPEEWAWLVGPNDKDDPETARPGQWEQA